MKAPLLLSFVLSGVLTTSYCSSPPVQVELRTSWPAPPPLLEILETVATEDTDAFFALLDLVTNPEALPSPPPTSSKALRHYVLDTAIAQGHLSEPGVLAAVEMSLGLHTSVPKIEAFYQHYLDRHAARRHNFQTSSECESWVDWYGQVVCDVETLRHLARVESIDPPEGTLNNITLSKQKLLPFDHINPLPSQQSGRPSRTAVLYGSLSSSNFRDLHTYLYKVSSDPTTQIEYVFRPIPPTDRDLSKSTYLSGYGVALDLKKMEYLAVDDRRHNSKSEDSIAEESSEAAYEGDPIVALLQQYPENITADYTTPLTEEELLQIGLQSAQLIHDSEEPLATLRTLAQNFPKYASATARRVVVENDLEEEIAGNQVKAQGGISMAWLNGVVVPETEMNPFALLRLLRKERNTMLSLMSLGLSSEQSVELLTHKAVSVAQSDSGVLDGLFDASDRAEEGDVIVWWNDFENDSRYARWGGSIRLLLRPLYPGQLPSIKLNLFNVVLGVDLSQSSSLNFIAGAVSNIINRSFPFRFGIVPIVETEEAKQMARLLYWMIEHTGRARTMEFFKHIAQMHLPVHLLTPTVNWPLLRSEFKVVLSEIEDLPAKITNVDLDNILNDSEGKYEEVLEKGKRYAKRLGMEMSEAGMGHAFVNGKHFDLDDDFLRQMQTEVGQQLQHLQEQLYAGHLDDSHTEFISTYFYDLPEASKRRNKHIYPSGKPGSLKIVNLRDVLTRTEFTGLLGISYVYPPGTERAPLTTYVVADLDSPAGLGLVKEVLSSMTENSRSRVSFIHNPSSPVSDTTSRTRRPSSLIGHLITSGSLSTVSPARLLKVLGLGTTAVPKQTDQVIISPEDTLEGIIGGALPDNAEQGVFEAYVVPCRKIVRELKLSPGEQALVVNGRVVGPLGPNDVAAEDIEALGTYEYRKRVGPVVEALEDVLGSFNDYDRLQFSEVVTMASSIVSSIQLPDPSEAGLFNAPHRPRRRNYQMLSVNFTKFEFGDSSTALFHVGVLLDPLSEAAQKWSSIIEWLLNDPAVFVELHINPARYRELPLKRFYRYNLPSELAYDEAGEETRSQTVFRGLPTEPIYTLAMDVAQSWLVRPREALYDLDNIQLGVLSGHDRAKGVQAVFGLDYLVIEGHAREMLTNAPPRGLQLQLTTSNTTAIADTQVVANLGYLQFRTKPGVFKLEIRPGRGRDIFKMESVGNEGWDSPSVDEVGDEVTLTSFEGLTLYPRVTRLPGMERSDVLAESAAEEPQSKGFLNGVVSSFTSLFSSKHEPATEVATVVDNDHADINIFTVASGLLYERFASIMILSVLRNTNSTVKFWFIENFLSPSFLEFIPHFAKAYNFKYELVTYKWPSWLRAQKEKQRIIWAYKILFLDVLFPMDLKKVIFVDADQIVRTDLKELVDLDLHGAPYGYTPMGDDNTEMEGFRFWKTGYWKDFLQGLPYHISALYVVDLVRFRQIAAGDILRGHYQQLSADPNSLANLDQDLPNNLQREVPIFSLPEDWLWCETWCSKDRLDRAKTIDLCQNPLTKEPKLSRARQIPEWSTYDSEIAHFAKRLAEEGVIRSGIAAADANVLADAGSTAQKPIQLESDDLEDAARQKEVPTDGTETVDSNSQSEHRKDEL